MNLRQTSNNRCKWFVLQTLQFPAIITALIIFCKFKWYQFTIGNTISNVLAKVLILMKIFENIYSSGQSCKIWAGWGVVIIVVPEHNKVTSYFVGFAEKL